MFNRRTVVGAAAATTAFVKAAFTGRKAEAALPKDVDIAPRGKIGRLERLPTLDLESREHFLTGFRTWVNGDLRRAADSRMQTVLKEKGLDPDGDTLTIEQVVTTAGPDPLVGLFTRSWLSTQRMMWDGISKVFHRDADKYVAEMEAADKMGPGKLELNPGMKLPVYATHEIHIQPGGYVGDAFAGHVYHYGTNDFYMGRNNQDEMHAGHAASVPVPKDGKVRRILDLGCSSGQLAMALKRRFPDAEVWGVDVGGPMVRYAHMRAVDQDVDVNFRQALAEDTKFPAGHFDLVTSYLLHHEVTADVSKQIFSEINRVLRPGGLYYPLDLSSRRPRPKENAWYKYNRWWNHRWNGEVWMLEYDRLDFDGEMRAAGLDVGNAPGSGAFGGGANVVATKPG